MAEDQARGLAGPLVIGLGVFALAYYLLSSKPAQAATAALTTQTASAPGVVIRGKNYSAFIPLPSFLGDLFTTGSTDSSPAVRSSDSGEVLVQPGGGFQVWSM